jgi:hypothetical protein
MTYKYFMRLMGALILMSVITILFGGCTTAPTTPVWKYQTMQHCPVTAPPAKAAYLMADDQDKEGMLTNAYNGQTANVSTCNKGYDRMASWVAQQKALYPDAISSASAPVAASAPSK